jgi:glutamate synthase domain-containing protein 2
MRKLFFLGFATLFTFVGIAAYFQPWALTTLLILVPLFGIGLQNILQKKKAILRNFPLLGLFRYFFEEIRPEIQQYFVENDTNGTPIARETRSVVYQRAKQQTDTLPFGTQRDVYETGYEWLGHSLSPQKINAHLLRVLIGGVQCKKPYSASILNISAMSYGALSMNAIQALNGGAQLGGFFHNTGEGGVSSHHLSGNGDLVWQVGTGYFGCRDSAGNFSPEKFQQMAIHENIKMIEIKLSQGAKPAHGGILPAAKITPEIVAIRNVEPGKDVISPPAHKTFSTPIGLLEFVKQLRDLSGGKPVGFKLCLGQLSEFVAICKAMLQTNILPDFITVDGGEGGTGAAPLEFSNHVGMPLEEGLTFIHDTLTGFDLRKHIKIIASGKVMTGFQIFAKLALGADLCNSARGMLLALGCIQARKCNSNHCPTGIATSNEELMYGLVPSDKKFRVYNYHKHTVESFAELLGARGHVKASDIQRDDVNRRVSKISVQTYADLFPEIEAGEFFRDVPERFRKSVAQASAEHFSAMRTSRRAA